MNYFRVTFADGNTLETGMNATLEEARRYYIGTSFNFGDTDAHPTDNLVKAMANMAAVEIGPARPREALIHTAVAQLRRMLEAPADSAAAKP